MPTVCAVPPLKVAVIGDVPIENAPGPKFSKLVLTVSARAVADSSAIARSVIVDINLLERRRFVNMLVTPAIGACPSSALGSKYRRRR